MDVELEAQRWLWRQSCSVRGTKAFWPSVPGNMTAWHSPCPPLTFFPWLPPWDHQFSLPQCLTWFYSTVSHNHTSDICCSSEYRPRSLLLRSWETFPWCHFAKGLRCVASHQVHSLSFFKYLKLRPPDHISSVNNQDKMTPFCVMRQKS